MSGKLKLNSNAGGSLKIRCEDTLTTDDEIIIPSGSILVNRGDFTGDIDTLVGIEVVGQYGMVNGITTSTLGLPDDFIGANGHLTVRRQENDDITFQTIVESSGSQRTARRMYVGATEEWSDWVYDGIVSGSNSNGRYTKYPDGTLIQYGHCSSLSSGAVVVTLPISFIASDYTVQLTSSSSSSDSIIVGKQYDRTLGTFKIKGHAAVLGSPTTVSLASVTFAFTAIGRWK